ncbi:MAG: ATP-binding cassette domain-containing protein [Oscillospiraceae bacterium]|nr:ATP-binding cassette domain-containing protein [Oscillospiraceae bacterium]MDD4414397.1 ATP-binding cassette domain-containing protein [Oscillospiraceae bacterium]
MIEVQNLTKRYGSHVAVNNISFKVEEGEILGFLGPNGAGKTTTMNILTGYLSASSGVAKINDFDVLEQPNQAKMNIGYLPEQPPLYLDMTVREYLDFMFDLKKCKLSRQKHIAEICRLVKIETVYGRLIKNLSKGYRQRVGLAQALIGNPPVLIMDEPTVGLDPKQIIEIRSLIKSLGKNHTVILSSHILQEIEAVCDRIIIINNGVLIADDTASNLAKKNSSDRRLILRVAGEEDEVFTVLNRVPGAKNVTSHGEKESGVFEFSIEPDEDIDIRREVSARISARNWAIMGMQSMEMTLEEVFIALTREQYVNVKPKKGGRSK